MSTLALIFTLLLAVSEEDLRLLEEEPGPSTAVPARHRLVEGINAHGIAVFRQAAKADSGSNLVLSPYALSLSLNLMAHWAPPAEARRVRGLLGQDSMDPRDVDRFHAVTLAQLLDSTQGVYARFGQALWGRDPGRDSALKASLGKTYRAQGFALPSGSPARREAWDAWAYKTSGTWIKDLGMGLAPAHPAGLLSQVFVLHGYWEARRGQCERAFTRPDGKTYEVPMLDFSGSYAHADSVRILQVPFAEGRHALVLMLPDSGRSLAKVIDGLQEADWRIWMGLRPLIQGQGAFPELHLGHAGSVDPSRPPFRYGAFVKVGNTKHKELSSRIEMIMRAAGFDFRKPGVMNMKVRIPDPIQEFNVDRPFLFAIRDTRTGLLLMLGRMTDPAAPPR